MNLDALVAQGRLPWSPSAAADNLDIWHEYEFPRTGTFTTQGTVVLFTLVGGSETQISVWAYAPLSQGEAEDLADRTFASATELRQFVRDVFDGRQVVLALADDLMVSSWSVFEVKGELYEVATSFLEQVLAQAQGRLNAGTEFRAKLAQVDVATHDLLDA